MTRFAATPLALALLCGGAAASTATSGYISAPGRVDIAYSAGTQTLFISGGAEIRRYDMANGVFLSPIALTGQTGGMDISPDGKTLAIANFAGSPNSPYFSGQAYVDTIDLTTLSTQRYTLAGMGAGAGTFTTAFDKDGMLLVSGRFSGSGWADLQRLNLSTGQTTTLGSVRQDSMLSASADRSVIAVAESNISDGRWGYYTAGSASYSSQHVWYGLPEGGTSWFNFEIATSANGSQFAIPTYGGTFIGTGASVTPQIGTYAGVSPIGAAYSPTTDHLFLPFAMSNYIGEYDKDTLTEVARHTIAGHQFDWTGNHAFAEGRTKVSSDGTWLFSTIDDGIYFSAIPVPEPSSWVLMGLGLALIGWRSRRR